MSGGARTPRWDRPSPSLRAAYGAPCLSEGAVFAWAAAMLPWRRSTPLSAALELDTAAAGRIRRVRTAGSRLVPRPLCLPAGSPHVLAHARYLQAPPG